MGREDARLGCLLRKGRVGPTRSWLWGILRAIGTLVGSGGTSNSSEGKSDGFSGEISVFSILFPSPFPFLPTLSPPPPPLPALLYLLCPSSSFLLTIIFLQCCDKNPRLSSLDIKRPHRVMSEYQVPSSVALFWGYWNLWEVGPRWRKWGEGLMFIVAPVLVFHLLADLSGREQAALPPATMPSIMPACILQIQPKRSVSILMRLLTRDLATMLRKVKNI